MSKRIGVLTVIAVLAFPALAGAKVVVSQSIAGVNLGETMKQVHGRYGTATSTKKANGRLNWVYKGRQLLVAFGSTGRVIEVFTVNPAQRTAGGIGVGSSQAAVMSHIKGVQCVHVPTYQGKECVVSVRHGAFDWTTDFHLGPGGHVQSVLVNILNRSGGALDRALAARR